MAIFRIGNARGTRHADPFGRNDLSIFPLAVTQEQIAEARHIPCVDEHATAPMAAT